MEPRQGHLFNVKSWADFSTEIFGHQDGLIAKTYPETQSANCFTIPTITQAVCTLRAKTDEEFG